jgi:hypothetical protein
MRDQQLIEESDRRPAPDLDETARIREATDCTENTDVFSSSI